VIRKMMKMTMKMMKIDSMLSKKKMKRRIRSREKREINVN